jgi:VanZ family protein
VAFLGALAFAVTDEWHQSFVSGREPSLGDFLVDAVGALAALVLLRLVGGSDRPTSETDR